MSSFGLGLAGSIFAGLVLIPGATLPAAHASSTCDPIESFFIGDGTTGEADITYRVLTFDAVGTCDWAVPEGVSNADVLVVGGGGGGGGKEWAGGGGGGGVLHGQNVDVQELSTDGVVSIRVGAGGTGGEDNYGDASLGSAGGQSAFGSVTASGGGGGAGTGWQRDFSGQGASGGSGGGTGEHGDAVPTLLYAVDTPLRADSGTKDYVQYRTGYGIGSEQSATSFDSGTAILDRVVYRMQLDVGGTIRFAEVRFDPWADDLTANDLRVPDLSDGNRFEVQKIVSDMSVFSNMTPDVSASSLGVTPGTGLTGYLEIWPWNFSGATDDVLGTTRGGSNFDFNDTPSVNTADHGSFQVHNVTTVGSEETVISWTLHRPGDITDVGLGSYTDGNPTTTDNTDWTLTGESSLVDPSDSNAVDDWTFEILANNYHLAGGVSNLAAPAGWTAYGNPGGTVETVASQAGSGGGGAGASGGNVPSTSFQVYNQERLPRVAGDGGAGRAFDITGADVTYAGGGGGATSGAGAEDVCSSGGSGGGGKGACGATAAVAGTDGLGAGGGGGQGAAGADGGDGVVIVRYALNSATPSITIGNPVAGPGESMSVPVSVAGLLTGTYQAFVSVPDGAGTLQVTQRANLTNVYGYDGTNFTRNSGRELGFEGGLSDVEAALDTLLFTPASGNPDAEITVSIAQAPAGENIYYFPDNGHYYEYRTHDPDDDGTPDAIPWDDARDAASARTLFGLTGYLVTITSRSEQVFVRDQIDAPNIWIGATDDVTYVNQVVSPDFSGQRTGPNPVEGNWHWVTGPEAGTAFWDVGTPEDFSTQGRGSGGVQVGDRFAAWCSGEPNNRETSSQNEHYAAANYSCSSGVTNADYNWNDFILNGGPSSYLVEYGGIGASVAITASATAWVTPETPTGLDVRVDGTDFVLTWTAPTSSGSSITDYEYSLNGGTSWIGTGSTATTSTVSVGDVCDDFSVAVRSVIGDQVSAETASVTASRCNTITIVNSGGASEGSGWSQASGVITARQDVSINASVVSEYLDAGDLTIDSTGNQGEVIVSSEAEIVKDSGASTSLTIQTAKASIVGKISASGAGRGLSLSITAMNLPTASSESAILVSGDIDANGGDIELNGSFATGGIGSTSPDRGISLTGASLTTTAGGSISLTGDAGSNPNTAGSAWGLQASGSSIVTQNGDITIDLTGGEKAGNSRGLAVDGSTFEVLSESGTITIRDQLPDGRSDYSGLYLRPSPANAIVLGADGDTVNTSSSDIVLQADRLTFAVNATTVSTSGTVRVEPVGTSFKGSLTTSLLNIDGASGVNLGKDGNESPVDVARDLTVSGPITIHSDTISVEAALEATGTGSTITFQGAAADDLNGTLDNSSSGSITADNLLIKNLHQVLLRTHENVSVDSLAATGGHRLLLTNDQALEIGTVGGVNGISATEWVIVSTTTGDLTVSQQVGTTSSSSSAQLRLVAGADTAFGTSSGGDVIISGSGAISVPNAQAQVFSGTQQASTGLSAIADAEVVSATAPTVEPGEVAVAYRAGPPVFSSPTSTRFGDNVTLVATDPAGGSVTFSKVNSGDPCTISGTTLTPTGVGDCVVRATVGALTTDQTVTISKAPQTISFTSTIPTSIVGGVTYTPTATASSGLTVSFAITAGSPAVCELSGGVVTVKQSGTCTIQATQSGNSNFLAATAVTQTFDAAKDNQTITFGAISDKDFGDPSFTAGATVSSGLSVTYSSSTTAVCTVGSSTGVVELVSVGDCTITANASGNARYSAAPEVTRTFSVQAVVPGKTSLTSVSFGDQKITVGFVAPGFTGGSEITGYRAVVSDGSTDTTRTCGASSPCTITGLTNGTEYTVTLAAVNSAGVGPASDTSPGVTPATNPRAVADMQTTPGDEQLQVSWSPQFDYGGGTFTRYDVSIRESGESSWGTARQITTDTTAATTFTGLENGTGYDVKIVTISSANSTEITSNTVFALGVPMTVPDPPTDLELTALSSTTALASWSAPLDDGGDAVRSYALTPSCTFESPTDTTCTLTGLTGGSTITVQVGAMNLVGTSTTISATVTLPAPASNDRGGSSSSDSSSETVVTPPVLPRNLSPATRPGRLPVVPQPSLRPDVLSGPMQFPGGPTGPLSTPRGFIGGVPAPVNTSETDDGGVEVQAGSLRLGLTPPQAPDALTEAPAEPRGLSLPLGQSTSLRGAGLLPGSQLQIFLPGASSREFARIPVNDQGEFDGELNLRSARGELPMPIGAQTLQAIGYDEDGNQTVVDLPVNIAQPTPAPELMRDSGEVAEPGFGQLVATSAGIAESVTITVLPEVGVVDIGSDQWSFQVNVSGEAGQVEQVGASAQVRLFQARSAEASGSGFQPGTRVDVWLFSDPTLLGSVTVDESGQFVSEFYLDPRFATIGDHTLQLQGVGTDGFIKAVNLGVQIDDPAQLTESGASGLLTWLLGLLGVVVFIALVVAVLASRRQRA